MKKHNFSAGPAILPQEVFEQASNAVLDLDGIGLSILEISHRSPQFKAILEEARSLAADLFGLGDEFEVLYLTGGASSQFFMSALNLLPSNGKAGYVNTGAWSTKAIKEAKLYGTVEELASSKDQNFNYIPKGYDVPADSTYLHLTSNNTIFGTQFHDLPETNVPIVADMSSDIYSKPIDPSRYGLIYAGAQKNLGPAGTTLVMVRKNLLGKVDRDIPTMLDYNTHINKDSAFNTPPVYPIYCCLLSLRWIQKNGGVEAMAKHNESKAKIIYDAIDRNPLFTGTAAVEDRSLMNACFVADNDDNQAAFLELCTANGISGIKGHRSVGGFRASIYNAMSMESVQVLADLMDDFAAKRG
ncbi:MAG: 3-phosphoserine/phosphohydroxythreonine transaminase [Bacteroidota bacterium]